MSDAPVFVRFVSSVKGRLVPRWDVVRSYIGARVTSSVERAKGAEPIVWDDEAVVPLTDDFCRRFDRELREALSDGSLKPRTREDYEAQLKAASERKETRAKEREAAAKAAAEAKAKAEAEATNVAETTLVEGDGAGPGLGPLDRVDEPSQGGELLVGSVETTTADALDAGTQVIDASVADPNAFAPVEPAKKPSKGGK